MEEAEMPAIFGDPGRGLTPRAGLSGGRVRFPPELDPRGGETDGKHEHRDCPRDQSRWLERRPGLAATMRPHAFCVTCGKVKSVDGPRARKLGFYLHGLSALKEYLRRSAKQEKMTQSQSRLVTKALEGLDDFEDTYGLSLEVQAQLYLQAVKRVRPDLEDELVLRLLPRGRRRSKRPFMGLRRGAVAD